MPIKVELAKASVEKGGVCSSVTFSMKNVKSFL